MIKETFTRRISENKGKKFRKNNVRKLLIRERKLQTTEKRARIISKTEHGINQKYNMVKKIEQDPANGIENRQCSENLIFNLCEDWPILDFPVALENLGKLSNDYHNILRSDEKYYWISKIWTFTRRWNSVLINWYY